ncbi:28S ribosomal protein S5 [Mactra antiquata]
MAATCLRTTLQVVKTLKISDVGLQRVPVHQGIPRQIVALSQLLHVRYGSFFNRKDSDENWDSIRSVSNQGRKRGRASRGKLARKINLDSGKLGEGITGLVFPGLSKPINKDTASKDLGVQKSLTGPIERSTDPKKAGSNKRKNRLDPYDRGFRGDKLPGKKVDPPDPVDGYTFPGFEAYALEAKFVSNMVASQGKVYKHLVVVVVGNKKGLIGLSLGKGTTVKAALKSATNKAAKQLTYINVYNQHTIWHKFAEKFHQTTVIAEPRHLGFGKKCHPVLNILCELAGIKDIHITVEGSKRNYLNMARAFMVGLQNQKTHQEIADELGQNIVEYHVSRDYYPVTLASPSTDVEKMDTPKAVDFTLDSYHFGNRTRYMKPRKVRFYQKLAGYKKKQAMDYKRRNQSGAMIERMVLGLQPEFKTMK